MWTRVCQECRNEQTDKQPPRNAEPTTAYMNRKCKKCKSMGLDYGSEKSFSHQSDDEREQSLDNNDSRFGPPEDF